MADKETSPADILAKLNKAYGPPANKQKEQEREKLAGIIAGIADDPAALKQIRDHAKADETQMKLVNELGAQFNASIISFDKPNGVFTVTITPGGVGAQDVILTADPTQPNSLVSKIERATDAVEKAEKTLKTTNIQTRAAIHALDPKTGALDPKALENLTEKAFDTIESMEKKGLLKEYHDKAKPPIKAGADISPDMQRAVASFLASGSTGQTEAGSSIPDLASPAKLRRPATLGQG